MMHKYFFHIGDFNRATRHLTRLERSVYRDLIDLYMETEFPLDSDIPRLCRKIIATSQQESTAVEQVLNEFFILTPDGYVNMRCDTEISLYKNNNSQKSEAGKASALAKALRKQQLKELNECSTDVQQTFNESSTESQLTSNHKPITNNQERASAVSTKRARKQKTSIPENFTISERVLNWATEKGHKRLDERLEHFVSKAKSNGYTYVDWDEAFMGAVRDDWAKLPTLTGNNGMRRAL